MRLHRLTLQAIGPYAGEHTIDFVELGRAGLFLLEGPTGAGKSTIIDAIVFGLYGELAGTGASKDRLHSHHAVAGTEPFVELVFETASGVYRVRRTPAYQRPKQRGDGFTPQQASATLIRLTDPDASTGETLSTRAQEIGPEISRIVGLTREQFVQTIVLPQGEFAKFLSAGGEERSELLRSLFGTEHYERLARHLVEQRRQAHRDVEGAEEALGRAIARFSGAAELSGQSQHAYDAAAVDTAAVDASTDADEAGERSGAEQSSAEQSSAEADLAALSVVLEAGSPDLADDASRIVAVLRRQAEQLAERAAEVRSALEVARAEHDTATKLEAALRRRSELLAAREQLAVDDEPIGRLADRVAAAVRADTVASALAGAQAATEAHTTAEAALEAVNTDVGEAVSELDDQAVASRRESITAERAGMAGVVALEAADAGRAAALVELEATLATIASELDELSGLQRARESRRAELASSSPALEEARAALREADRLVEANSRRGMFLDRIERADQRLTRATAAVGEAAARARAAVEAETALRLRRIDGLAGELAAELRDDEPCSVCGSRQHPDPARLDTDHPDADDVDAAAAARLDAEAAVQTALGAQDAARAERRQLIELSTGSEEDDGAAPASDLPASSAQASDEPAADIAADDFDLAQARAALDAAVDDATARRTAAALAADAAEADAVEAARLAEEHLEGVLAASTLTAQRATLTERVEAARLAHERARAEVAAVLDERADSLAELDALLAAELAALHGLASARAAVADRRTHAVERAEELRTALLRAGFADEAEARSAGMHGVERAGAEARVEDHRRRAAANTAALAEPAIAALTGAETSEVEAKAIVLAEVESDASAATAAAAVAARRADNAATAVTALEEAVAENAEAVREAAAVIRLADVVAAVGGENTTRVTLGTYVLLRRFEDVVAAANSRLESMSGGRYELVRSDTKEGPSRSQRVGLSLTVHDHRTNRRRDPKSLSGGETFYASLCLALGLADVVTGEAGGVELGTLFVDEGFGSLDPETLDTVMAELGRLSAGGRVVGVVSHVEEMKQRIGERIEVRRLEDGSSTLLVRA